MLEDPRFGVRLPPTIQFSVNVIKDAAVPVHPWHSKAVCRIDVFELPNVPQSDSAAHGAKGRAEE
ncbi:MAG TPA: hypothetical protein VJH24_00460 [Candidatus Bilamarchaeaceae archaeon]|nr:hypothetical protein [Candidatus Bilamarchaeaceae archaeon]